jgi:four helix bundle protein
MADDRWLMPVFIDDGLQMVDRNLPDMSKYQSLDAWKISMQLVKEIYILTKMYPKEQVYALTSQTKRAAVSVPANIAEGMGRQYKKETLQFLHISRGSLYELETLLNIAVMVNILKAEDLLKTVELVNQCMQLLNGLIKYITKSDLK